LLDSYQTIAAPSKGIYKAKGSKFIAFAYPIFDEHEFKEKLQTLKKEYHDARHHCYAYQLGLSENKFRFNDDGEPSSTAGKPIFGQIQSFKLTNITIIVIRYFGGTKLGVGGLITAYKEAAKDTLNNAKIITKTVDNVYQIEFNYNIMSKVMNFVKHHQLNVIHQVLNEKGIIQFKIRQTESEEIIKNLQEITSLKITFLKTI